MDGPIAQILGFVVVLTRVSLFLAIVPVFGLKSISVRIRISVVLLLSIFFSMLMPTVVPTGTLTFLQAALMIAVMGFISTVSTSKYLMRGDIVE